MSANTVDNTHVYYIACNVIPAVAIIPKGFCPYYLAPSRGGVEARAGPHDGDTENPIMSTPHPYLVTGGPLCITPPHI